MYEDFPMSLERDALVREDLRVDPVSVGFTLYPRLDNAETEKQGRPIYKDCEYVRIATPGDRNAIFFQPATELHKKRFPKAYKAFKERDAHAMEGTPLEHWPMVTRAEVWNFKAIGIHTVEHLANVHDGNLNALGHRGRDLRSKAKGFLAQAENSAAAVALAKEKEELQGTMAQMQEQINDLCARLEKETAHKGKKAA